MGDVARSTTKRMLIAVFLFSILAVSSANQYYSPGSTMQLQGGGSGQLGGVGPLFASDPQASARPVNDSAIGFDSGGGSGRTINLPNLGTSGLPVTLDYGWSSGKITATVLGLWDQRNWIRNGTFDTGRNTPYPPISPPWTYRKWYDTHQSGHPNASIDTGSWVSSGNSRYITATMPWQGLYQLGGGTRDYYTGEYSAWNETFTLPRGTVLAANLSLNYNPRFTDIFALDEFQIFVQVNSHFVYEKGFAQIKFDGENNKWNLRTNINVLTDVNGSSVFNTPAQQTISISIGVIYVSHTDHWTNFGSSDNGCWFDNVTLALKALVRPDQVQLKLRQPSSGASTNIIASNYGSGNGTLTGFTIGPAPSITTYDFGFTSNVTSPTTGSFSANATVYVTRQRTATTTFVSQGNVVNWSISLVTAFQQSGQFVGTTKYSSYYFNVTTQKDWNLTTCLDPSGGSHTIKSDPNFSNRTVGSIRILKVNVAGIGSYSTLPNLYPYIIHAISSNYIKSLTTQLQSGSTWVNSSNFYPTQTMKFVAYIRGSSPISTGIANLTIRGPPTYNASPAVIDTITGVVPVSGFANFTKLLPTSYAAGNYSAQVDWVDSSLGEAGSLTSKFNVTHVFTLSVAFPASGDVISKGTVLFNPPTSVSVRDFYTGQFVTASVKGRASWESAGRWDTFTTFSTVNATYTNVTYVPSSLTVGNRYWLAANATKPFYDKATANSTFWIGSAATVGTQTAINVYYTETNTFFVKLDQIPYKEQGGGDITNATISLSASISSNDTLVKWSTRFSADYSHQGTGTYSGWIYIGTLSPSVRAIPPGTYTVWFKLSQGQYYETKFFSLQLTIFPAISYLDHLSGSDQYVFWGQTAVIKLNFTTYWSYGSYSLSKTPIVNDSSPYVRVICGWAGGWTATHSVLDPDGMYTLSVDTTSFATPTDDGSGAGTTSFNVRFNKTYYVLSNSVPITLHIMRLTTSMTGAVRNGVVYSSTNTTSVYSGDSKSIYAWYNDTHTGLPVGIGGSSITYTSSGGNILGSGTLNAVAGTPGLYNLTLSGASTNQIPGTYQIFLTGSNTPHYVTRSITLTLNVLPIPSTLQTYHPPTTIYYLDRVVFLIWYNDTHNGLPISGATISVTAPGVTIVAPSEVLGTPGLYNLTIPAGQTVGDYNINVGTNKTKYADGATLIHLHITSLPTVLSTYSVVSGGQPVIGSSVTVPLGGSFTIYMWFNDTHHVVPIPGMQNFITYNSTEFGQSWVTPTGTPGLYRVPIATTPDAGIFTITLTANAAGYDPQVLVFTVTVQAPAPGFSLITLMLVGVGGGGAVLVGALALLFMRRARIPFIVKKIDESMKLIAKGDHEGATPVALRSREELIVGITQERVDAFTAKKPAKGEATESLAGEPPVEPPTTGASAALKTELEAVETKEKPGEAIEEVEMDTLDQELQKLEKFEDKEKLPDGAKEVRDVIEKYKDGKKKKPE
ncbi:MAG: hypothetical protein WED04_07210 [Promethearchaeati archaeon SRVP18_Atabeyarchaeia-1]